MQIQRSWKTVPVLAIGLLAMGGCGDAGASAGWAGTVDTLANGAVLVSNPERGVWGDSAAWRIEEELRIGEPEIEGPDLFGSVVALAVDGHGRIWVAESQANELRVFDAEGAHVRTVGRKGGGPGEFEQISGMGWGPDGNLWVMDTGNSRIAVIDTSGAFVTSHRRESGFVAIPWQGGFDAHGRVYDVAGAPSDQGFRRILVRYDATMTPLDTFWIPEYDAPSFDLIGEGGVRRMSANVPFSPNLTMTFDGNGDVWMGITDDYVLYRVGFDGDTLGAVAREHTPQPVTAAEKEEALGRYEWFTRQGGELDPSKVPSVKPAFGMPFFDDQGYLWVRAVNAADAPPAYDIFDPDLRYLGQVAIPGGSGYQRPLVIGDALYAVMTDEMDIPYVVRARLVGRETGD